VLALHRIWIDEKVRRFLWDGMVVPLEGTKAIVDRSNRLFEERGYGLWGVRELGCDELVGFAGYWHFRTPSARAPFWREIQPMEPGNRHRVRP
jgi:RimJ/RimL family protein N-acetyltransferase